MNANFVGEYSTPIKLGFSSNGWPKELASVIQITEDGWSQWFRVKLREDVIHYQSLATAIRAYEKEHHI